MSWIKDERSAVADLLTAGGIAATAHVPSSPVPPMAMVVPGTPYVEGGDTFGGKIVRFDVWIVAGRADNAALSDSLDDLIEKAIDTLEADDVHVEQVSQPISWQPATGAAYLVAIIGARLDVRPPSSLT